MIRIHEIKMISSYNNQNQSIVLSIIKISYQMPLAHFHLT